MIEYITETGVFGILWILTFIAFIYISYSFIKRNGIGRTILIVLPILIMFLILNSLANELLGKSRFDMAITLAKDMWFLMGHTTIMSVLVANDRNILTDKLKATAPNSRKITDKKSMTR